MLREDGMTDKGGEMTDDKPKSPEPHRPVLERTSFAADDHVGCILIVLNLLAVGMLVAILSILILS